jgi:hypothetical protein
MSRRIPQRPAHAPPDIPLPEIRLPPRISVFPMSQQTQLVGICRNRRHRIRCPAQVCNIKVVTDANPDYHDIGSMIHSITSRWESDREKCWALFYWTHIARRQTSPMIRHGLAVTDPIRQFNDYGYMMCSTISGANCAVWGAMGYEVRYWDITAHTVSEVKYDGRWHMYDNSMTAIYTLCDGVTIAGVEDIGATLGCEASGGKARAGPYRPVPLFDRHQPRRVPDRRRLRRPHAGFAVPLLPPQRAEIPLVLQRLGPRTPLHPESAARRSLHAPLPPIGRRRPRRGRPGQAG